LGAERALAKIYKIAIESLHDLSFLLSLGRSLSKPFFSYQIIQLDLLGLIVSIKKLC